METDPDTKLNRTGPNLINTASLLSCASPVYHKCIQRWSCEVLKCSYWSDFIDLCVIGPQPSEKVNQTLITELKLIKRKLLNLKGYLIKQWNAPLRTKYCHRVSVSVCAAFMTRL
ncbi:hypothetical protein ILYODFUR_022523 [Ilyodon furcidens]|uniref:Uncharacterized protein n=1 Tax=Ilyodon furcidens TaxID=33524 RepID=A0ABV0V576_9TELE